MIASFWKFLQCVLFYTRSFGLKVAFPFVFPGSSQHQKFLQGKHSILAGGGRKSSRYCLNPQGGNYGGKLFPGLLLADKVSMATTINFNFSK